MLRQEPVEIERSLRKLPEACSMEMVMNSNRHIGYRIANAERSALLLDAFLPGCPIVGVSIGFEELTGRSMSSVIGRSWQVLFEGVDKLSVSRSACQDVDNFLRMARMQTIDSMADCTVTLACQHADDYTLQCRTCFRLVKAPEWLDEGTGPPDQHLFVLAVQADVTDMSASDIEKLNDSDKEHALLESLVDMMSADLKEIWPEPSFFPAPLSSRCMLLNCVSTGMRREPHQVPRGCVLMSASELCQSGAQGRDVYTFQIRVERTLPAWTSRLPFLGFTCTPPTEVESNRFFGSLPHAFCLAQCAMIGGTGEAWLQKEETALKLELGKQLEQAGMQRKHLTPQLPEHRRTAPLVLRAGDVLGCRYEEIAGEDAPTSGKSLISMSVNGDVALTFELDGKLPSNKPVYAIVDVCYCVYQVSMMSKEVDLLMGG